ncbi:MAG: TonB-dependent receptor [Verrucomicrobiae bacterium]|nr:TonB-dependent receptor [Verrucomicrobiae bacterium]
MCGAVAAAAVEPAPLMEVLVTAPRADTAPLGATWVAPEMLESLPAATSDSASLLRDVPGFSLYGAGGVSSLPAIRGLADDRLRTSVDGMDLIAACPNHMNPALSYIDPGAVGKIKVYTGAVPVSVGGDSIGGAIVVESAKPQFALPGARTLATGELGTFYRSNGDGWGGHLRATVASDKLSLTYAGSTVESANYEAGGDFKPADYNATTPSPASDDNPYRTGRDGHSLPLDEVGSTAYESTIHSLDLACRLGDHLLDLTFSHQDIPYQNFPNQRMDMTSNESDKFGLGYEGRFHWGQIKARAYHDEVDHEMDFGEDKRFWYGSGSGVAGNDVDGQPCGPVGPTCARGMPMNTEARTTGLSLGSDLFLSERDTLRIGLAYQGHRLDDWWPASGAMMWPGTFWNIRDGQRDRYAIFGEWEAKITPQWTSLLGIRHETVRMNAGDVQGYKTDLATAPMPGMDVANQIAESTAFNDANHKKTDRNWDFTALARFTPSDTQDYEVGVSRKTRSPNLYERYTWSTWSMAAAMNNFVGDGNGYFGDIDLEPEVAHTLSLSADWHDAERKVWGLRVAPYCSLVDDFIDAKRISTTPSGYSILQYVNQDARLSGVDLSAHVRLAHSSACGDLTLSGLASYARGENRSTDDNLYNIMPFNTKLALAHDLGRWRNALEWEHAEAKDDVSAARNEISTDAYDLFNLRSSYTWKHLRIDLGIENIFGTNYDLPLGGAYVGQGKTMTMANAGAPMWGTAVPGPGRKIYVGVSVRF